MYVRASGDADVEPLPLCRARERPALDDGARERRPVELHHHFDAAVGGVRRGRGDSEDEYGENKTPDQGGRMVRSNCEGSDIGALALRVAGRGGGYTGPAARMWRNW